jgi:prepilin-type N-terminal cleavage/methylation domain-containing protein
MTRFAVQLRRQTSRDTAPRRGLTLAELLISLAIVATLSVLVIVGTKALMGSQARSVANQQMTMIAEAIDRYASFWPKWKTAGVTVADKGWPDYIPGRLFDQAVYDTIAPFNDDLQFDIFLAEDTLSANICLAYALTEASGGGPYLDLDDDGALFRDIGQVAPSVNPLLPAITGQGQARRARVLVDPWGMPYRYFWAYRTSDPAAPEGLLPVFTADVTHASFHKADRFVVESAGPDRKFGNVWRINPSQQEINEAFDNLVVP